MRGLKWIVAVFSFVGMIFSFVLFSQYYQLPYFSQWVAKFLQESFWQQQVIPFYLIILTILFLFLFIATFFLSNQQQVITIIKSKGSIQVPKSAIESAVRQTCTYFLQIKDVKSKVMITSDQKVDVQVILYVEELETLPTLGEKVQNQIKEVLEQMLEVDTSSVEVLIKEQNIKISSKELQKKHRRVQ